MAISSGVQIRATRATPPGRATESDRRETYGATLAQFDELMDAAATNSPAARPLPLFYALSQAGRAIAAARAALRWRLRGHGFSSPELGGDLLDIVTKRIPTQTDTGADSFTAVAAATGSEVFERRADIGSLWASLPGLSDLLPERPQLAPLLLVPEDINARVKAWDRVGGLIVGFDGTGEQLPGFLSEHRPTAAGGGLLAIPGMPQSPFKHTPYGPGYSVWWPTDDHNVNGHLQTLDRIVPSDQYGPRWLRPAVSGVAMSELMTW